MAPFSKPQLRAVVGAGLLFCAAVSAAAAHDHHASGTAEMPMHSEGEWLADMAVTPTGDIDRDFVAMMVPHHQGAIDMAEAVLRYGHNETLRRLAQEIVVTQQQEIAAMRLAVGEKLPPSIPSPTQPAPAPSSAVGSPQSQQLR